MRNSNITFVSNDYVFYDLQQTGSTGVLIRLTSNELTENSTLPQILHYDEVKLYIPGCKL